MKEWRCKCCGCGELQRLKYPLPDGRPVLCTDCRTWQAEILCRDYPVPKGIEIVPWKGD